MFDVLVSDVFIIEWRDICGCYVEMKREHSERVKEIHSIFKCDGGLKSHRLLMLGFSPMYNRGVNHI
jgi:hypothetical protein